VIQAAPNDIPRTASATEATAQEVLVSTEAEGGIGHGNPVGETFYRPHKISPPASIWGLLYMLHRSQCASFDAAAGKPMHTRALQAVA
jgi:hypothetical protein